MKRTWAGDVRNVSLLVPIGVNAEGSREILGICEGATEDKSGWLCCDPRDFLHLMLVFSLGREAGDEAIFTLRARRQRGVGGYLWSVSPALAS